MKKQRFETICETFINTGGVNANCIEALSHLKIKITPKQLEEVIRSDEFQTWMMVQLETKSNVIKIKAYTAVLNLIEDISRQLGEDDSIFQISDKIAFFSKLISYINQLERTKGEQNAHQDPVTNIRLKIKKEQDIQAWREKNVVKL